MSTGDGVIPDYAELKDPPPHHSVLEVGFSSEGVRSASVSRTKFDNVKDKLKTVQVNKQQFLAVVLVLTWCAFYGEKRYMYNM